MANNPAGAAESGGETWPHRAGVLYPARDPAGVALAREVVAAVAPWGAAAAWEALAARDLVPLAWAVGDSARRFAGGDRASCPECRGYDAPSCRRCRGRGTVPVTRAHPVSLAACAALAVDAAGLATAEALAWEAAARLVALGVGAAARRVVWRVVGRCWHWSHVEPTWQALAGLAARHKVEATRAAFDGFDHALRAAAPELDERTRVAITNLQCFAAAWPADAPQVDPFAPLVALWTTTGYGLQEFNDTDLVLVAPTLAGDPDPAGYHAPGAYAAEETVTP